MGYASEHIADMLKSARESKGLSQRGLSAIAGVPQSHISKIETGEVDLRLSSLVELARALDLELALVPRKAMPAVQSIIRSTAGEAIDDGKQAQKARKELTSLQNAITSLPAETSSLKDIQQLQRQARELQNFRLSKNDLIAVHDAYQQFKRFLNDPENTKSIRQALLQLQQLRNALAHAPLHARDGESPRPAYNLDEDDHA